MNSVKFYAKFCLYDHTDILFLQEVSDLQNVKKKKPIVKYESYSSYIFLKIGIFIFYVHPYIVR